MLSRIWAALTRLVEAIESLAETVNEANARTRAQLALDQPAGEPASEEATAKKPSRKSAA